MAKKGPASRRKKLLKKGDATESTVKSKFKEAKEAKLRSIEENVTPRAEERKKKKRRKTKLRMDSLLKQESTSMKAKKVNFGLQGPKLHVLTDAPLVGVVAKVEPGVKTGAKNDNIWQDTSGSSEAAGGLYKFMTAKQEGIKVPRVNPEVEGLRNRCAWKSRKQLQTLLGQPPPLVSWERWQATCKMQEYLAAVRGSREDNPGLDPLLPENPEFVETGLVNDLMRCAGKKEPGGIVKGMAIHSATMARQVRALAKKIADTGSTKDGQVMVECHKHTYDVYLKLDKRRLLKLNTQHYKKLQKLYIGKEQDFHRDLYLVLADRKSVV